MTAAAIPASRPRSLRPTFAPILIGLTVLVMAGLIIAPLAIVFAEAFKKGVGPYLDA
jgi:ABC-type sulfate transport system permease subunit